MSEKTLLILDWDDTLLPSSWLQENNLLRKPISDTFRVILDKISASVNTLLTEAQKHGSVVIVTNGESGWVESSCKLYMPQSLSILEGIRILSARSAYEHLYANSPVMWKCQAFQMMSVDFHHIISIGDSNAERYALHELTNKRLKKSVKLENTPTLETFVHQLNILPIILHIIVPYHKNLDIACDALSLERML